MKRREKIILRRIYYDPAHPQGFGGINPLSKSLLKGKKRRSRKVVHGIVKNWLLAQPSYYLHRIRRNVRDKQTIAGGIGGIHFQWEADLIFFPGRKNFIPVLCIIDVFSKRADARLLMNKKPESVVNAFKSILNQSPYLGYKIIPAIRHPYSLRTDSGTEFRGKIFRNFIEKENIQHYFARNDETKACFVERFNRTLKTRIQKYMTHKNIRKFSKRELEVLLTKMLNSYNKRYHSTIKMSPMEVTLETQHKLFDEKNKRKIRKKNEKLVPINSRVRISRRKGVFSKGYSKNFTSETFKVIRRSINSPHLYQIEDSTGNLIEGKFYADELLEAK